MKNFLIASWFFVIGFIVSFVIMKDEVDKTNNYNNYVVIPLDKYDQGRQQFDVRFRDTTYEYMFPEEIANSLIKGEFGYNEDISLINN